ncbi:hypothetical protein L210DRAFT_3556483 [Boletus edulis BED1]|uniref:GST N-terminal domain-containing protein n=1 Tax=Boletus edulis BED1 TaxID=1328754 RepID=A0AAD4BLN2_BOLED|nr:hypothetical protein L210DRAFT_3556483 [Boletus edulis BED1]
MTSPPSSPETVGAHRPSSVASCPFPERCRFVLSYKKPPFDTVFVDIALKMKEIGASPNKRPDGSKVYTLPVLSDPNTGALITDSWAIAVYLDETYPEKPVFLKGSRGRIRSFDSVVGALLRASLGFNLLRSSHILNERSQEPFTTAKEERKGNHRAKILQFRKDLVRGG